MLELDSDMERIAGTAAIAHHKQLLTLAETMGHRVAHVCDRLGVPFKELLLYIDALTNLT
jgi:hypothetical protein